LGSVGKERKKMQVPNVSVEVSMTIMQAQQVYQVEWGYQQMCTAVCSALVKS
jgi:hypothetical protein